MVVFSTQLYSWEYDETSVDLEGRAAMMATAGKFNPYVELKGTFHGDDKEFRYSSITAGTYFRTVDWLKIGAFYKLQKGARHLEDWQFDAGPPDTHWWNETSDRFEHLLYFDATPRFLLPRLPGKNWIAPLKFRYFYNFTNGDHSLLIRPGLTYVFMPDRKPLLNLTLNYNLYFALNRGDIPLYSHGPYLTVLGHINDWIKVEGKISYRYSVYFKEDSGSWTLNSKRFTVGFGVIFTPVFSR